MHWRRRILIYNETFIVSLTSNYAYTKSSMGLSGKSEQLYRHANPHWAWHGLYLCEPLRWYFEPFFFYITDTQTKPQVQQITQYPSATITDCLRDVIWFTVISENFIIGLTDVSPAVKSPVLWKYDLCAQWPGIVGSGVTVQLRCADNLPPRRYLILQLETYILLQFCELQVYVRRMCIYSVLFNRSLRCLPRAAAQDFVCQVPYSQNSSSFLNIW